MDIKEVEENELENRIKIKENEKIKLVKVIEDEKIQLKTNKEESYLNNNINNIKITKILDTRKSNNSDKISSNFQEEETLAGTRDIKHQNIKLRENKYRDNYQSDKNHLTVPKIKLNKNVDQLKKPKGGIY